MWGKERDLRPTRFRFGGCFLDRTAEQSQSLLFARRPASSHALPWQPRLDSASAFSLLQVWTSIQYHIEKSRVKRFWKQISNFMNKQLQFAIKNSFFLLISFSMSLLFELLINLISFPIQRNYIFAKNCSSKKLIQNQTTVVTIVLAF